MKTLEIGEVQRLLDESAVILSPHDEIAIAAGRVGTIWNSVSASAYNKDSPAKIAAKMSPIQRGED